MSKAGCGERRLAFELALSFDHRVLDSVPQETAGEYRWLPAATGIAINKHRSARRFFLSYSDCSGDDQQMDFVAALKSPMQHPKWALNILLVGVCFLIPVVGPILVMGYHARCLRAWQRGDEYPEFNFQFFVEYLKNGLWPFLVTLAVSLVVMPLMIAFIAAAILGISGLMNTVDEDIAGAVILALGCIGFFAFAVFQALLWGAMVPLVLKSSIEQDFAAGFSWTFFKDFVSKVGGALFLAVSVLFILSIPAAIVGYLALFVGVYFTMAWWSFAAWHVYHQLYQLYLERGGMQLVFSPKLETRPDAGIPRPPAPPAIPETAPPLPLPPQ